MSEVAAAAPAAPTAPQTPAAPAPAEGAPQAAQNTAEQAPATAPEGVKPDTDQDPEKRGQSRFNRRLDRAYKRAAEAEARASFLEKQFNEFKAASQPAADPSEPKLEQFKDIEEYAKAKAEHASKRALAEHQAKLQGETARQQTARLTESWAAKMEAAAESIEDLHEVVSEDLKPTTPALAAIMEAENGPAVAHYLLKNPKEMARIEKLTGIAQILELGKVSAMLAAEPPKAKTPSRAPAPITPVTGTAPAAENPNWISDPNLSQKEWVRRRNEQIRRARGLPITK